MRFQLLNKRKTVFLGVSFFIILLLLFILYRKFSLESVNMVMGGKLYLQSMDSNNNSLYYETSDVEQYFRPSKLPVLNNRVLNLEYTEYYYEKELSEIKLPEYLFSTPKDTILNYYSVLREAANPQKGYNAGCGTLGNAKSPYPIAYHFLSSTYQDKISLKEYLNTFRNILHINLIKLKEVPIYEDQINTKRYFVEIETIEGSEKDATHFAYYYGFIDVIKDGNNYKISDMNYFGENYLCAPYHGWDYIAEAVVDIKYGGWCSLVEKRYATQQTDFTKYVCFKGTDGNDYLIEFFQLTNEIGRAHV